MDHKDFRELWGPLGEKRTKGELGGMGLGVQPETVIVMTPEGQLMESSWSMSSLILAN